LEAVEAVRAAGDIVGLISDYVPLRKSGARLKGLCPFHDEKTPSFSVDPDRQLFYCFGCQTGGDVFKFVELYEKVSFREALEMLARRWGVTLPSSAHGPADPNARLLELNRSAADFFRAALAEAGGAGAREYLVRRGLERATVERLGLGFAPDAWEALRSHLVARRFHVAEVLRGGLVLERKTGGGHYDRFRNRLVFPIRDLNGNPVAFGGRALGDAEPKYINSPETPVYTKGDHLYGLDQAREAIRREGLAIVVEGYMDLAALVQAGFDNVVATLGTAFTPAQARLVARFTGRVVISYDGDAAGANATARSIGLLLEKGLEVRALLLPGGSDPDDYLRSAGREAYARLLQQAPEYLEFLVQREVAARDLTRVEEKVAAVNAVLPHVAKVPNSIARAAWASRLADALTLEEGLVLQELRKALLSAQPRIRARASAAPVVREAEARLVHLLLGSEHERAACAATLDASDLQGHAVAPIVQTILRLHGEGRPVDAPSVLQALEDDALRELLTRIAFRDEPAEGPGVEDCLFAFRRERLLRQGRELLRGIGSADPGDVDRQLSEWQRLARQRDELMNPACEG
jgi:DNA primase